jgi:hypothetical protein
MKSRVKAKARGKRKSAAASKPRAKSKVKTKTSARRSVVKARPLAKPTSAPASQIDPLDNWIVASASALGLRVEKSWMPAVRANLRVTLDQGLLAGGFPLPDDAEPAPVYRA